MKCIGNSTWEETTTIVILFPFSGRGFNRDKMIHLSKTTIPTVNHHSNAHLVKKKSQKSRPEMNKESCTSYLASISGVRVSRWQSGLLPMRQQLVLLQNWTFNQNKLHLTLNISSTLLRKRCLKLAENEMCLMSHCLGKSIHLVIQRC